MDFFAQGIQDTDELHTRLFPGDSHSLKAVLDTTLNVRISKCPAPHYWHQYPLFPESIIYAAEDVFYLPYLYQALLDIQRNLR